jgi:hypothetical protein
MTDIAPPPRVVTPGYTGPERRTRERERQWREDVNRRFDAGSEKMDTMHRDLQANTAATLRVQQDTAELVVWLQSLKGAFAVFDVIGKAAKPVVAIAGACMALWGLYLTATGRAPK